VELGFAVEDADERLGLERGDAGAFPPEPGDEAAEPASVERLAEVLVDAGEEQRLDEQLVARVLVRVEEPLDPGGGLDVASEHGGGVLAEERAAFGVVDGHGVQPSQSWRQVDQTRSAARLSPSALAVSRAQSRWAPSHTHRSGSPTTSPVTYPMRCGPVSS